ncbi:hypothetical protein ACWEKT_40275 [Nocardia takedensis]
MSKPKGGRPWGSLRGETSEFNDLAQFLRDQVTASGLTLKQLEASTGLRSAAISQRLSGVNLARDFVVRTVTACVASPALAETRDRRMQLALRLWEKAMASRDRPAPPTALPTARLAESAGGLAAERQRVIDAQAENLDLYRQMTTMQAELDLVSRSALKARAAEQDAAKLSLVLSVCVWRLSDELQRLRATQASAISAVPVDATRIQAIDSHIASVEARHIRSTSGLAEADATRDRALQVLTEAIGRRQVLTDSIRRLAHVLENGTAATATTEPSRRAEQWPTDFDLGEVDRVLDRLQESARDLTYQIDDAATDLETATETRRRQAGSSANGELRPSMVTPELVAEQNTASDSVDVLLWQIDRWRRNGELERIQALVERGLASRVALDNPAGLVQLLVELRDLGAKAQMELLGDRVANQFPINDVGRLRQLLDRLRRAEMYEVLASLADRVATQIPIDDPRRLVELVRSLRMPWTRRPGRVLADRVATQIPLNDASGLIFLLERLPFDRTREQRLLLADRGANQIVLDKPRGLAMLLVKLHELGAHEQTWLLADRIANQIPLEDPSGLAMLLATLHELEAHEQTCLLADRIANQIVLDDLGGLAELSAMLEQIGQSGQTRVLADRVASSNHGWIATRR